MMPDLQCTLWPDVWFGVSITPCCIAHDLGGTDGELAVCVASTIAAAHPWLALPGVVLGTIMYAGVAGPLGKAYRAFLARDKGRS